MSNNTVPASATGLPDRRFFLAAGSAVAVFASPLKAIAAEAPDGQLIRLGAEFDRLHAEFARIKNELSPIHEAFDGEIEAFRRRGEWPSDGWLKLRHDMGVEAAIKQENAAMDQVNAVTDLVRSIPAKSIAGMAVKMKILAFELGFIRDFRDSDREIEWPEQCFNELLQEVARAGNTA